MQAMDKSRVLVVGGTGFIGRRIVRASLAHGHPTFVLMRPEIGLDIDKLQMLLSFKAQGARLLQASLDDHAGLVAAVKQVDVVISAMGGADIRGHTLLLQHKLVKAIKEAGNIKRFLPSEFGMDPSRMQHGLEPGRVTFDDKMELRRALEGANIPHTYISANCFAAKFCANLCQMGTLLPPKEKVNVYGDGNVKAIFVDENDVATYTVKSIDDPRTLNKTIYLRPQENVLTQNEVIAKWEKLSGKNLDRIHVPADEFLASMKGTDVAHQVGVGHFYHIFYEGCLTNFDIGEEGEEATRLYPLVEYTRMDEYMKRYLPCDTSFQAMEKSRVLVVGGTGYIGRRIVRASLAQGHPTFVLARPEIGLNVDKLELLLSFKAQGARLVEASLDDHAGLVAAVAQVDVVISAMSGAHIRSHNLVLQHKLVEAIKEAGNIKRFLPSEFGMDPARMTHALEPGRVTFDEKMELRRAIEEANIPHTYISANCFAAYFCPNLCQMRTLLPPKEKMLVYGDGNAKAIFVDEDDVATYTIKSIDDPRALNKTIYIRPQENILTQNEVIKKWEKLSGKVVKKIYTPADEFLASMKDMDFPNQVGVGHYYHIFYESCLTNFEIGDDGAEASLLYPEVQYTRVDEYMKRYL